MNLLLSSLVDHPAAFSVIAVSVLASFVLLATWPVSTAERGRPAVDVLFCALAAATVFAWRWPVFISSLSLNPDEGQMTANALKAMVDIVPWRGFDGTTSGPLNSDVLALAALAGAHIDFFSARVIGVLLVAGALSALYFAIRWTYDTDVARIALVPPVLLLAFVRDYDFVHYSSEHVPLFLTAVALASSTYLLACGGSGRRRIVAAALGGLCIGCVPFAKLQAVPIAAVNVAFLATAIGLARRMPGARLRAEALTAAAAIAVPAVAILGAVALAGEWDDFVISYLRFALLYVGGREDTSLALFLFSIRQYTTFLLSALIAVLAASALLALRRRRLPPVSGVAAGFSLCLLAASVFAIYEAHRPFPHYLLLSVVPVAWCAANFIGLAAPLVAAASAKRWTGAAFVLLVSLLALRTVSTTPDLFMRRLAYDAMWFQPAAATVIQRYAKRGDAILVWGWMPRYYVDTGTVMATRDANTFHQIENGPLKPYFRARFMRDLALRPPRVIVDAVAPKSFGYTDDALHGIATFPQLAALVRERYVLAQNVDGVRVFRLR